MSNPRDHSRHPARVPTSDATDSASVPWSGRELSPSGFETDTGATDPALLAALTADDDTLMAAVVTGRFLVPIVAEPVEIDDSGPLAADTMFHAHARTHYDAAICMYHDQALIPLKTLHFDAGVNVTLGLPIVRTSPDHGTAFDIAGKRLARADAIIAAIRMAGECAVRREA